MVSRADAAFAKPEVYEALDERGAKVGALSFSEVVRLAPSLGAGGSEHRKPGWPLHSRASRYRLLVRAESIMEIPPYSWLQNVSVA